MADNSTLRSGTSKESADIDSIDPSTSGPDVQTQPDSTGKEGDHADSNGSDAGSDAESDVEEEIRAEDITTEQRGAIWAKALENFDMHDPKAQEETLAALKAAKTKEEKNKIYGGPMFRPPPMTKEQEEQEEMIERFMSGDIAGGVAMCKKDKNGFYVNS